MKRTHHIARIREEVIIEAWSKLNADSLGASELQFIHRQLISEYGESPTQSPAYIARVLAERGAQLRHSEVLAVDTEWRRRRLTELFAIDELDFSSLSSAFESMQRIEQLRQDLERDRDEVGQERLREAIMSFRRNVLQVAQSRIGVGRAQVVAEEVAGWFAIWLQNPKIFLDWLDLRRNSAQYSERSRE